MTTKIEMLEKLNQYRINEGKNPLKSWKQSNEDLIEVLAKYETEVGPLEETPVSEEVPEKVTVVTSPKKSGSVKSRTIELLTDRENPRTSSQIATILVEELGAKYSPASVAWYACKLRKTGTNVYLGDSRKKEVTVVTPTEEISEEVSTEN